MRSPKGRRETHVLAFADPRLVVRTWLALVLANARYWPTVAPSVRRELRRWGAQAAAIRDPALKALALAKLREERFNAEVAATLATLAPRAHRELVTEAIVALELLYDYLDVLIESPSHEALRSGRQLFTAFTDALDPFVSGSSRDYYRFHAQSDDDGYLEALVAAVKSALAGLPANAAIAAVVQRAAGRCAEAQIRAHAVEGEAIEEVREWATSEAAETVLQWREFLAGSASSVLAVHALVAAAADARTTPAQAAAIDTAYLSIAVCCTMLDSLVDYEQDVQAGAQAQGYIRYYKDLDLLAHRLTGVARHAVAQAHDSPNGPHHVMTLAGVVAYYSSAPAASGEPARAITTRMRRELRPIVAPTLAVMRVWRLAKRLHAGSAR
jgi:tetraprenyl-beta-curcumene synthase